MAMYEMGPNALITAALVQSHWREPVTPPFDDASFYAPGHIARFRLVLDNDDAIHASIEVKAIPRAVNTHTQAVIEGWTQFRLHFPEGRLHKPWAWAAPSWLEIRIGPERHVERSLTYARKRVLAHYDHLLTPTD